MTTIIEMFWMIAVILIIVAVIIVMIIVYSIHVLVQGVHVVFVIIAVVDAVAAVVTLFVEQLPVVLMHVSFMNVVVLTLYGFAYKIAKVNFSYSSTFH